MTDVCLFVLDYRKLVKNKKDKKGDKSETEEAMEEDTPADM